MQTGYHDVDAMITCQLADESLSRALDLRRTSRRWRNRIDTDLCDYVQNKLTTMLHCVNPRLAARALCDPQRYYQQRGSSHFWYVKWYKALVLLDMVEMGTKYGVVAGGCVLYLELLTSSRCAAELPTWFPGDVDCWVQAAEVVDAMSTETRTWSSAIQCVRFEGPRHCNIDCVHTIVTKHVNMDIIRNKSVYEPNFNQWRNREPAKTLCGCCAIGPVSMCNMCCYHAVRDKESGNLGYAVPWAAGDPHSMFDLDITCVALRPVEDGRLRFDRLCGDPRSGVMVVRPQVFMSIVCPTDLRFTERVIDPLAEWIVKRAGKYHFRGWKELVMHPYVLMRNGNTGVTRWHPLKCFDALAKAARTIEGLKVDAVPIIHLDGELEVIE